MHWLSLGATSAMLKDRPSWPSSLPSSHMEEMAPEFRVLLVGKSLPLGTLSDSWELGTTK